MPPSQSRIPYCSCFTVTSLRRSTTNTRTFNPTPSLHRPLARTASLASTRSFTTTRPRPQQHPDQNYNFYRTHGRAFFKTFTLAFLTYQILYWGWLTLEAEEEKDAKNAQIKSLEGEIRLLREGRGSHTAPGSVTEGRRILDEGGDADRDGDWALLGDSLGGGSRKADGPTVNGALKEEPTPGKNQGQDIDGMLIPGVKGVSIHSTGSHKVLITGAEGHTVKFEMGTGSGAPKFEAKDPDGRAYNNVGTQIYSEINKS
jgi:hypothetical protein